MLCLLSCLLCAQQQIKRKRTEYAKRAQLAPLPFDLLLLESGISLQAANVQLQPPFCKAWHSLLYIASHALGCGPTDSHPMHKLARWQNKEILGKGSRHWI